MWEYIQLKGRLTVRVVHATQDRNDRWVIGCAFAAPLSEEELQAVLAQ
jgi:hypothetical protein